MTVTGAVAGRKYSDLCWDRNRENGAEEAPNKQEQLKSKIQPHPTVKSSRTCAVLAKPLEPAHGVGGLLTQPPAWGLELRKALASLPPQSLSL